MRIHIFLMQQTLVFVIEKRRSTVCFEQKVLAELARHLRTRSFAGGHEKRPEALRFVKKIHVEHVFSVKNPMARRPFQSNTDGPDAMTSSGLSQPRDLAKVDDFEPLSL